MPVNIQHDTASALKVGHESVSSSYIGHEQVYPNSVEISNFRFPVTDAGVAWQSQVPLAGSTLSDQRNVEITGAIGSTFTLAGASGVSSSQFNNPYTLTTSPFRFRVAIDSNNSCDASSRTPTVAITPTGSTVLKPYNSSNQTGVSTPNGGVSQVQGPSSSSFTPSVSFSVTENSRVLTYVGGSPRFAAGSSWTVTATVGVDTTKVNYYSLGWYKGNASGSTSPSGGSAHIIANNAGSGTLTFNITGGDTGYVRFHVYTYANSTPPNCYSAMPFQTTTSNYYP